MLAHGGLGQGNLIIRRIWPDQMLSVYINPQRFFETYETNFDGVYTTGDSSIATPEILQWSDFLPKTRSGKIIRRILKNVAADDFAKDSMGDTSTLADPNTVEMVIEGAKKIQIPN